MNDRTEYGAWGRRLSENRLRSFNWPAECVSFARMKAEGKTLGQIAEVFGLEGERDIEQRIALGNIPRLVDSVTRHGLSLRHAVHYLLPLRIETGRNPENGNERIYDYSEVTACIDKLVSGDLTPEDLPSYSANKRVEIEQRRQEDRNPQPAGSEEPHGCGLGTVFQAT